MHIDYGPSTRDAVKAWPYLRAFLMAWWVGAGLAFGACVGFNGWRALVLAWGGA